MKKIIYEDSEILPNINPCKDYEIDEDEIKDFTSDKTYWSSGKIKKEISKKLESVETDSVEKRIEDVALIQQYKADVSALGTQATFSLSGTTLRITF